MNDVRASPAQQGLIRCQDGRSSADGAERRSRFGSRRGSRGSVRADLMVVPGSQLLVYPVLWILMPDEARPRCRARDRHPVGSRHERLERPGHRGVRANDGKVGGRLEGAPTAPAAQHRSEARRRAGAPDHVPGGGDAGGLRVQAGADSHTDWFHNLKAHAEASIEVGTDVVEVTARVLDDAEREPIWEKQKADFPGFAGYEEKTDRVIPVAMLRSSDWPVGARRRGARRSARGPARRACARPRPDPRGAAHQDHVLGVTHDGEGPERLGPYPGQLVAEQRGRALAGAGRPRAGPRP